jgi:hypothetical protein
MTHNRVRVSNRAGDLYKCGEVVLDLTDNTNKIVINNYSNGIIGLMWFNKNESTMNFRKPSEVRKFCPIVVDVPEEIMRRL